MKEHTIKNILLTTLKEQFNVPEADFDWNKPLLFLHEDFKLLSTLLRLEQSLNEQLQINLQFVENISTYLHTPNDILDLIMSNF